MTKQEAEMLMPFARGLNQQMILEGIIAGETSISKVAISLGKDDSTARRSIRLVKARAAQAGVSFENGMFGESVPEGFQLTKSKVHIKDGSLFQRWDCVEQDKAYAQQAVLDAISESCSGLTQAPRVAQPKKVTSNLLNLYTIADLHIGLYAWARESGEDYTTPIAKEMLWTCFSQMLDSMPPAESCIIANLGDFIHYDGLLSQTPAHHNVLDSDSRYQKLAEVALDLQIWMVETALKKHKRVHIVNVEGNHDEAGTPWLKVAMSRIFSKNPRVSVDVNPAPYHATLHGETMLAWHHGHKRKDKDLSALFSADPKFRAMWGMAKRAYIHTGHLHSQSVLELPGAVVERHPTLAARSSYEARGGWQSHRGAKAICYDNKGNETMRVTVVPEV